MKLNKKTADTIGAFLGSDSEFEGQLTFQGTIRIDGRYKGNITVDGTLIVGHSGRVNAEISASNMIISGEVTGNMTAATNIEVHASGKVYGNLVAPTVTIHEGAVFQGQCHSGEKGDRLQGRLPRLHTVVHAESPQEQKKADSGVTKSA
jgi:cytoskeletal protein CcmA (bactofilin family)